MDAHALFAPGTQLPLISDRVIPLGQKRQHKFSVDIKRWTEKWTLSCGMFVGSLNDFYSKTNAPGEPEDEAFLKLYDWRFADQLRRDGRVEPWSGYLHSGSAHKKLGRPWDQLERDAFLYDEMRSSLDNEIATYNRLAQYQGKIIPKLYSQVRLQCPRGRNVTSAPSETYQVHGILIESIKGFSLGALMDNAPNTSWQNIVDQAVQVTHILGDHDIVNRDVRPDNFMVVPLDNGEYKVYMIDFGQCRLRRDDESDAIWGQIKWQTNEEGGVGFEMQDKLHEVGFKLDFQCSSKYQQWAAEDER
ncbi:kinase-like domain-containing protein [Fusarium heterosporum]|uniref:Kinase-like domain-containing protein n=1 Tax=Fusarium heterosporum TaxID=42747 RepID=A0A8H5T7C4_FUSHE|nr:kinase-like domain-containing protein [Fusarium heterosporum]